MLDGEAVVINLTDGVYYSLDGTGALAWAMAVTGASAGEIAGEIAGRYGAPLESVRADVNRLLEKLVAERLLLPARLTTRRGPSPRAWPTTATTRPRAREVHGHERDAGPGPAAARHPRRPLAGPRERRALLASCRTRGEARSFPAWSRRSTPPSTWRRRSAAYSPRPTARSRSWSWTTARRTPRPSSPPPSAIRSAWWRRRTSGPAATRNRGLRETREFVAFLDADDLWHPEKLARQLARFEAHPSLQACIAHVRNFWEEGQHELVEHYRDHRRMGAMPGYATTTLLARRSAFEAVGELDTNLWFADAVDWFMRARELGVEVELLPDVLTFHRLHPDNLTRRRSRASEDEFLTIVKGLLDRRRGRSA